MWRASEVQVGGRGRGDSSSRRPGQAPAPPVEQLLALQRAAGNVAVARAVGARAPNGRLLQRVSRQGRAKLGKPPFKDQLEASEVDAWQKRGTLTDADIDKLLGLGEEFIDAVQTMDPAWFKGAASSDDVAELYAGAKVKKQSAARGAEAKRQTEALAKGPKQSAAHTALTDAGVSPSDATAFLNREDQTAVRTWASSNPPGVVKRSVEAAIAKNATLAQILEVQARNAALRHYDPQAVAGWVLSHGVDRVRDALEGTRADANPSFVELWLSTGANTATSSVVFKKLVRLQARLKAEGTTGLHVSDRDVPYVGSHDPPSRTGFLVYDFGGDEDVELHTHWNEEKKKVVSVHVKEGADKSTEINTWSFFGDVTAAVVAAHNAATGNRAPTTRPPGGKLTA